MPFSSVLRKTSKSRILLLILACSIVAATSIPSKEFPGSCEELQLVGYTKSGVYEIYLKNSPHVKNKVWCDLETNGGGWTVIQRRAEAVENAEDFYRTWVEYQNGFGRLDNSFWLGLDLIADLTKTGTKVLQVELKDWNDKIGLAEYDHFSIGDETALYKLKLGKYTGGIGDSFVFNNGYLFTTKDVNNSPSTRNCTAEMRGGWWYSSCARANLNGLYYYNGDKLPDYSGIFWQDWHGSYYSVKKVEMKIRDKNFTSRK